MARNTQMPARHHSWVMTVSFHAAACVAGSVGVAAKSCSESGTPAFTANPIRPSRRQAGIRPLVFQLETVEGVSERAAATALVPPNRSMMSLAVCIGANYDNRNCEASS